MVAKDPIYRTVPQGGNFGTTVAITAAAIVSCRFRLCLCRRRPRLINCPIASDYTLTTAAEIGAALPHLLGFHPEQSVICLWSKCRQLVVTQRADTPDEDLAASSEQFTEYVDALFAPVRALDVDEVIVVYVAREPVVPDGLVRGVAEHCPVSVRVHLHMRGARIGECTPGNDHGESWRWIGTKERQQAAACIAAPRAPRPARTRQAVAEELSYRPRDGELETDGHARHDLPVGDLMTALTISPLRVSSDVLRVSLRSVAARDVVLWCAARMALVDRCALLGCLVQCARSDTTGSSCQHRRCDGSGCVAVRRWSPRQCRHRPLLDRRSRQPHGDLDRRNRPSRCAAQRTRVAAS